jgi:hypothetical protein
LYELETQQDVSQFIQSSRSGDYAIVLPYQLLNKANLQALGSTNRIAGLIVIVGNGTSASPDSPCPNCEFGLYDDPYTWNPTAQSLIQANFDFPIFAIRPSDPTAEFVYNIINAVSLASDSRLSYSFKYRSFHSFRV